MLRKLLGWDWKASPAHRRLLQAFCKPNSPKAYTGHSAQGWKSALKESVKAATKRFIAEGLIEVTKDPVHLLVYKYSAEDLRRFAEQLGLPQSGTKTAIAKRLVAKDPQTAVRKARVSHKVYICTEAGKRLAEQWKNEERQKTLEAERQILDALRKKQFKEALQIFLAYDRQRAFPYSKQEMAWPGEKVILRELKLLWRTNPTILKEVLPEDMLHLRAAAGLSVLSGKCILKRWLPEKRLHPTLENDAAARMMLFAMRNKQTLQDYQLSDVVIKVRISAAHDACPACKRLAKQYPKDKVPELPNPACTNPMGCRCTYIPIIEGVKYK